MEIPSFSTNSKSSAPSGQTSQQAIRGKRGGNRPCRLAQGRISHRRCSGRGDLRGWHLGDKIGMGKNGPTGWQWRRSCLDALRCPSGNQGR